MDDPKSGKYASRWRPMDLSKAARSNSLGGLSHGIKSDEYLIWLGRIVVQFGHLEQSMRELLRILLRTESPAISGIVFNTIIAPKTRIELLANLLSQSPDNAHMPQLVGDIIAEYEAINKLRNAYIHGLWYTPVKGKTVRLARTDGEGISHIDARSVPISELEQFYKKMKSLEIKMSAASVKAFEA